MGSCSTSRVLAVILVGGFLACHLFTVAAPQGTQQFGQNVAALAPQAGIPAGGPGFAPSSQWAIPGTAQGPGMGTRSNDYSDFFREIALTSLRAGVFYGGGNILVDDSIGAGQNQALLYNDFSPFVHHRKADLKDAYFSGVLGIGTRSAEFLTFSLETNFGARTKFNQYTDAGNFPISGAPQYRWYRAALGVLALGNEVEGQITLNNKNRYWAFDLCARLPVFATIDLLGGYKWLSIKSYLDPYSAEFASGIGGGGPSTYPVLPGQSGWIPAWRDTDLTSITGFEMHQQMSWHGPFIGARLSNVGSFGTEWLLDTRVYPWYFGKYTFTWSGAWLDPTLNFTPGIFGSQSTNFTGNQRWGIDVDFRCRNLWGNLFAVEFEARYSYAWMSGSCVEYQSEGNIYSGFGPSIDQNTPESITIQQNLWMVGGSVEYGF